MGEALSGDSHDPCVGRFLEFRIVREPAVPDESQVPATLIPNPDLSQIPVARERTFVFGTGRQRRRPHRRDAGRRPVGHQRSTAAASSPPNYSQVSAAPSLGTARSGTSINDGGGWDHPIHIHFEEGQILARNGSYRQRAAWPSAAARTSTACSPSGTVTLTMQFRDWGGMFMEHCHNTTHEDNAMLLRWDINGETVLAAADADPDAAGRDLRRSGLRRARQMLTTIRSGRCLGDSAC